MRECPRKIESSPNARRRFPRRVRRNRAGSPFAFEFIANGSSLSIFSEVNLTGTGVLLTLHLLVPEGTPEDTYELRFEEVVCTDHEFTEVRVQVSSVRVSVHSQKETTAPETTAPVVPPVVTTEPETAETKAPVTATPENENPRPPVEETPDAESEKQDVKDDDFWANLFANVFIVVLVIVLAFAFTFIIIHFLG